MRVITQSPSTSERFLITVGSRLSWVRARGNTHACQHHARPVYPDEPGSVPYPEVCAASSSLRGLTDRRCNAVMELFWAVTSSRYDTVTISLFALCVTDHIMQSFINGIIAYQALPRPQFSTLQQALFPVYFSLQTALPVVMALTYPGTQSPLGSSPSGPRGFFAKENRLSVLAPITTIFAMNLTNLLVLGPATTRIMRERKRQGMLCAGSRLLEGGY